MKHGFFSLSENRQGKQPGQTWSAYVFTPIRGIPGGPRRSRTSQAAVDRTEGRLSVEYTLSDRAEWADRTPEKPIGASAPRR